MRAKFVIVSGWSKSSPWAYYDWWVGHWFFRGHSVRDPMFHVRELTGVNK